MHILLFTLSAIVLIVTLVFNLRPREKEPQPKKNTQLFKDAWNRIDGNGSPSTRRKSSRQQANRSLKDSTETLGDDYVSDLILRTVKGRRGYYRDVYLKSAAWQRKRMLVLKRDNWVCVHCGSLATQVHHRKYARKIGKEPIEWLESICAPCHTMRH